MRIVFAIIATMLSFSAAQAADDRLWPTSLQSLGDCVTPRISAPHNPMQDKVNHKYCTENNVGDAQKIKTCLENSATRADVEFFTDRCGEAEGVYYISLNGTDYTLQRVSKADGAVPYAGKFKGEGLEIDVIPGKLLKRELASPEEGDPQEISSEEYAVTVKVTKAAHSEIIEGVFWQGH